jgi:protein melted
MSNIVHEILFEQDLSRAGELFSINNEILLKDFATTIDIIKNIVDNRKYVNHLNEQSIVEIVLTRCISALRYFILSLSLSLSFLLVINFIRDTKIITNYYEELLDLLEICLKYNLNKIEDNKTNTPHANIVSDIFSCILLVINSFLKEIFIYNSLSLSCFFFK